MWCSGLYVWLRDGSKAAVKVPPGCLLIQVLINQSLLTGINQSINQLTRQKFPPGCLLIHRLILIFRPLHACMHAVSHSAGCCLQAGQQMEYVTGGYIQAGVNLNCAVALLQHTHTIPCYSTHTIPCAALFVS